MRFGLQAFIMNTFVILFFTMMIGNLFGKIKFGKFSFGIAGTLFMGLFMGFLLTIYAARFPTTSPHFKRAAEIISGNILGGPVSTLSLLIFIVATGFSAAKDMKYALTNFGKQFLVLAIIIPLAGAGVSYTAAKVVTDISPYQTTGTYTGALTSSAGLAAALESAEASSRQLGNDFDQQNDATKAKILKVVNDAKVKEATLFGNATPELLTLEATKVLTPEDIDIYVTEAEAGVGIGHSIGYPFGVFAVVLAVNFLPNIFGIDVEAEKKRYFEQKRAVMASPENEKKSDVPEVALDFAGFSLAIFLGYILGSIEIYLGPLGYFSLGSIGGSIIVSLLLGNLGKVGPFNFNMNAKVLGSMRTYFLAIFLAGTGLNFGHRAVDAIIGGGIVTVLVAIAVAIVSILVGFLVGHYIFKINWVLLSGAITGGMTSAPGLGAAIDAVGSDEPAVSYGATQPISTLLMVLFSLLLHKLPI